MKRLALWLAEVTDRWARSIAMDDTGEWLAEVESGFEVWEIDHGEFIDRTVVAPVTYLDEYQLARRRHPAGSKLARN